MSTFDDHLNFYKESIQSVALVLQSKLRLYDEESWTDISQGIPYLSLRVGRIKQAINTQTLDTEGVLNIKKIEVDQEREKILVDLLVDSTFGEIYVDKQS